MVELVRVRHLLGRSERSLVAENHHRARVGVVHTDHLLREEAKLDLHEVVGGLDQAEADPGLLVELALGGQVVLVVLIAEELLHAGVIEHAQLWLGERLAVRGSG